MQIGLDALMRDRPVLHVAVGQSVEHVAACYDALFDELAARVDLKDRRGVRESMRAPEAHLVVADGAFGAQALDEALAAFQAHLGLGPATILIDGFELGGARGLRDDRRGRRRARRASAPSSG